MLDILRQKIEQWAATVVPGGQDVNLEMPGDLTLSLYVDGGLYTIMMFQAMEDGDYDYVFYAHFLVNEKTGKTSDYRPEHADYRFSTEDEDAGAFLKLIAAMA